MPVMQCVQGLGNATCSSKYLLHAKDYVQILQGVGVISPGHVSASVLAAVEGWEAARWQHPVSWCSEASK